jgi:hypothetical protein
MTENALRFAILLPAFFLVGVCAGCAIMDVRRKRTPRPEPDPEIRLVMNGCDLVNPGDCTPLDEAGTEGVHVQAGGWIIPARPGSQIVLREGTVLRALPEGGFVIEIITVAEDDASSLTPGA